MSWDLIIEPIIVSYESVATYQRVKAALEKLPEYDRLKLWGPEFIFEPSSRTITMRGSLRNGGPKKWLETALGILSAPGYEEMEPPYLSTVTRGEHGIPFSDQTELIEYTAVGGVVNQLRQPMLGRGIYEKTEDEFAPDGKHLRSEYTPLHDSVSSALLFIRRAYRNGLLQQWEDVGRELPGALQPKLLLDAGQDEVPPIVVKTDADNRAKPIDVQLMSIDHGRLPSEKAGLAAVRKLMKKGIEGTPVEAMTWLHDHRQLPGLLLQSEWSHALIEGLLKKNVQMVVGAWSDEAQQEEHGAVLLKDVGPKDVLICGVPRSDPPHYSRLMWAITMLEAFGISKAMGLDD